MPAPLVLSPTCAEILALLKAGPRSSVQLARATGSLAVTSRVSELRTVLQQRGLQIHTELARPARRGAAKRRMAIYTLTRIRTPPGTRSRRGKRAA